MKGIGKKQKWISWLLVFAMLISLLPSSFTARADESALDGVTAVTGSAITAENSLEPDTFIEQPGGKTVWRVTGTFGDLGHWDVTNDNTKLTHLVGEFYAISMVLPAGDYEFKFTRNGNWNDNPVGRKSDGNNFSFSLTETTKLNFYISDDINDGDFYNKFRTNVSFLEEQGIKQYIPTVTEEDWPRLVGNLQDEISGGTEGEWDPASAKAMFVDYYYNGTIYKIQRTLPRGVYECKALFGNKWDGKANYGDENGNNHVVTVDSEFGDVTFTLDLSANKLTSEVSSDDHSIKPDSFLSQPGGNNTWRVTGNFGSLDYWDPSNPNTVMSHLVGEYYAYSFVLPAGNYEFKFTKNGGWDGSVGNIANGGNFSFTLTEETKVNFYINDELGSDGDFYDKFRTNLSLLEEQGIKQYNPALSENEWPRLVGDLQIALGETSNWSPSSAKAMFVDYYFNNSVYKLQRTLPKGTYECKIVFGNSWNGSEYGEGDNNMKFTILDATADVTFSTDRTASEKILTHDYKPQDSIYDGKIDTRSLYFNSRELTYKKPFGAIKQGLEGVTFRFRTKTKDASLVKLELIDGNGISKAYNMKVTTVLDGMDYWEVSVPAPDFHSIGIWGYKFIVIDGGTKVEYGDDGESGGTGAFSEEGQTPYNLTVYAADYTTPDWMKEGIVYQIFPDRFFDGDTSNNRAKLVDGYRGYTNEDGSISYYPYQYFDGLEGSEGVWSDYPENPRQSEEANKPYYPDAKTDGQWTNEFYGGDIEGINEKLAYLKALGVSIIYLNPVAWAASNHKYDATDYKHLDPMFGKPVFNVEGDPSSGLNYEATKIESDKVYQAFADACKEQGIKLISDGVFNHVGDDSIYFDRYEKYPEIGAYEYWSRVWKEVEKTIPLSYEEAKDQYDSEAEYNEAFQATKASAEVKVKNDFKKQINPSTGSNYTEEDFHYINWFVIGPGKVYDNTGKFVRYAYEGWWGFDSLPAVASIYADTTNLTGDENATIAGQHEYNNVDYREHVIGYDLTGKSDAEASVAMQKANSQRWIWMGSRGWRLDVAPDVSMDTWRQFRNAVKSTEGRMDANGNVIEEPIILGEEWNVATHYLLGDTFDSVMNYQFRAALQNYIINGVDAATLDFQLEAIRENYPEEAWFAMLNLVDSHDTVRNITKIDYPSWEEENTKNAPEASDRALQLQALTAIFQMSYPGAPTIYYGDEVGVTGTKDPDSRRSFPWERVEEQSSGAFAGNGKYADLFHTYKKAAEVRNNYKDIFATGEIKTAYAQGTVIAYARKGLSKGGLSVINTGEQAVTIHADVTDFLPDGLLLKDQLGSNVEGKVENGTIIITVPAMTGLMMVSTNDLTIEPAAPANLVATGSIGVIPSVTVTWDAVQEATGYEVYRSLLEGTEKERIAVLPATDTHYVDSSVTQGTRYYYYVKTMVDTAKSRYSESASAIPSYDISKIHMPTSVSPVTLQVGQKTEDIYVTIEIPGLTDNASYKDKEVPGLEFTLKYYNGSEERGSEVRLRYFGDITNESGEVTGKTYFAAFEPTEPGTYFYYGQASINNGYSYVKSPIAQMEALTSTTDTEAPLAPVLLESIVESNRVTLNWEPSNEDAIGYEIYRSDATGLEVKLATVDNSILNYVDYMVNNDSTYTYRIAAFDMSYNRSYSLPMTITPQLTMVDVTMRLYIPEKVFTSPTDTIYVACDANGWNASGWQMKKPSGATDNNVVEYTFKMLSGKYISYKYTRGTWDTEALSSSDPSNYADPGYYGYSSIDTNYVVRIMNQGGNKMLIEDTVLRWVDMPLMITVPRRSYHGETIEYTTTESSFNLQASVPLGGIFTINGVDINSIQPGALDQYGNVRLDHIPLEIGLNTFILHIEPTQETRNMPWLKDVGRIDSQMSATTTIKITRESAVTPEPTETPEPTVTPVPTYVPEPTEGPSPTVTPQPTASPTPSIQAEEPEIEGKEGAKGWEGISNEITAIKKNMNGNSKTVQIVVNMNKQTSLPTDVLKLLKGSNIDLVLKMDGYTWVIHGKTIKNLNGKVNNYDLKVTELKKKDKDILNQALNKLKKTNNLKQVSQILQLEIAHNGSFPFDAELQLNVGKEYGGKYVYLNYYNEKTKKLEPYNYAKVQKDGMISLEFDHASKYVLTLVNIHPPKVVTKKTIYKNSSYQLKVINNLPGFKITYSTNKKTIATVSKTGKITAKKAGNATITTKIVGGGKTYILKTVVTVKNKK